MMVHFNGEGGDVESTFLIQSKCLHLHHQNFFWGVKDLSLRVLTIVNLVIVSIDVIHHHI